MFGYVIVNKPEMKIKDFDTYQAFYCGLCRHLHTDYGRIGQMSLNYDSTFLAILLTGLYEPESAIFQERCIIHPLTKHRKVDNPYIEYAADMTILLTYLKVVDDWQDEHRFHSRALLQVLKGRFQSVQKKYPEKTKRMMDALQKTSELEKQDMCDIDKLASLTGILMGEVMSYQEDVWQQLLFETGDYLGRFIYIMDAYDDIENDIKKHQFNPFLYEYQNVNFDDRIKTMLEWMIAQSADAFEQLPILEHIDILRNILYAGVWSKYETIRKKRLGEEHG